MFLWDLQSRIIVLNSVLKLGLVFSLEFAKRMSLVGTTV